MIPTAKLACFERSLEACYRVEQTRRGWLQGVVESFHWLNDGRDIIGFIYTVDDEQRVLIGEVVAGVEHGVAAKTSLLTAEDELALVELTLLLRDSAATGRLPDSAVAALTDKPHLCDNLFVHARNADGHNVMLVVSQPAGECLQELLKRLAVAIATGARLQRRFELQRLRSEFDATVMAGQLELARGKLRLCLGKNAASSWNVVERFEANGQHYLVACEPTSCGTQALSAREREILAYAASGHSNKEIAYELGISHSTVRVLRARAAKKLRVSDRDAVTQHDA